ncbi:MAG: hypothetical protein QOG80_1686 [Pseudonocardiales bacterium]|jgi:hypothetical protein|nr:hypothetical protein [Pseudonocardiales bacterium]
MTTTRDHETAARAESWAGQYEPSPVARIREQVALFEATDGTQGNTLGDRPVVILTSIGAKSGSVRKNPIMRVVKDGIYVAVASAGGAPTNPSCTAISSHIPMS